MSGDIAWAILQTLSYADVFSCPLSSEEIYTNLITQKSYPRALILITLNELERRGLVSRVGVKKRYYSLNTTPSINRESRRLISIKKIRLVKSTLAQLFKLPSIELIAISGSLARRTATARDDIDLFIITKPQTLWLTRLLLTLYLDALGLRRHPGERNVANKLCLNMIIDRQHLALPYEERDLFAAYEVAQMRPLFSRGNAYRQFLWENRWVREFLGNWRIKGSGLEIRNYKKPLSSTLFAPWEILAQLGQLWYMQKRRTHEVIQSGYLRFHPNDARRWILRRYRWRIAGLRRKLPQIKTSRVSHLRLFAD